MNLGELEEHVSQAIALFGEVNKDKIEILFELSPNKCIIFKHNNKELIVREPIKISPPTYLVNSEVMFIVGLSQKAFTRIMDSHNIVEGRTSRGIRITCPTSGNLTIDMIGDEKISINDVKIFIDGVENDKSLIVNNIPSFLRLDSTLRFEIIVSKGMLVEVDCRKRCDIKGRIV